VVLMATMTGSAGGLLRDVLANETPLLIRPGELYATTCIVGTAAYLGLEGAGVARPTAAALGAVVVIGFRLAARRWGHRLQAFRVPGPRRSAPPAQGQPAADTVVARLG